MDELATLSEMRSQVPADARYPAAREALLAEIAGRPSNAEGREASGPVRLGGGKARRSWPGGGRGTRRPILLGGLLAGAVAAGAVVAVTTLGSGGSRHAPSSPGASSPVRLVAVTSPMTLASNAAALAKGSPPPKPTQWIHTRMMTTTSHAKPSGAQVQDPGTRQVKETWDRVDFLRFAHFENGRLVFANGMPSQVGGWPAGLDYAYLQSLPTDPDRLLTTIRHNLATTRTPLAENQVFDAVLALMENYPVLPAKLNAALYGALARTGSVRLGHVTDLAGRPALSLYRTDAGIRTAILVSPSTYTYAGQQRVVVADSRTSGADGTLALRKGALLTDEAVLTASIVDDAGER
ncbi:CU044_5270 family protein [Actinomadura oligospora]|uniref:CU044_5270 family protein n=1 Tax=Actinomadura oligospora TaxID=111804 RepID=UPI00047DA5DA|nr:CU044_5270 family protein [Actinomadura oligospora]